MALKHDINWYDRGFNMDLALLSVPVSKSTLGDTYMLHIPELNYVGSNTH